MSGRNMLNRLGRNVWLLTHYSLGASTPDFPQIVTRSHEPMMNLRARLEWERGSGPDSLRTNNYLALGANPMKNPKSGDCASYRVAIVIARINEAVQSNDRTDQLTVFIPCVKAVPER